MTPTALIYLTLFSAIGFAIVWIVGTRFRTLGPSLAAFGVHWVGAISAYQFFGLSLPDAFYYDALALQIIDETAKVVPAGKEGWPFILAGIYIVFGHLPQIGLVINVIVACLTVSVAALIAERLRAPRRTTAWLTALLPFGIVWTILLLRESLTWFFMLLAILGFIGFATRKQILIDGICVAVGLVGLIPLRGTAAVIVGVSGLVGVAIARRTFLLIATWLVAFGAVFVSPLGVPLQRIILRYTAEQIEASREELSTTATTGFPIDNYVDIFARVFVGPAPWEWGKVGVIFAVEGLIWLVVLVAAILAIHDRTLDRRALIVVLLPAIMLLLSLVVTSGNYGTMQRLRLQPELILLPLAAVTLARPWVDREASALRVQNFTTV